MDSSTFPFSLFCNLLFRKLFPSCCPCFFFDPEIEIKGTVQVTSLSSELQFWWESEYLLVSNNTWWFINRLTLRWAPSVLHIYASFCILFTSSFQIARRVSASSPFIYLKVHVSIRHRRTWSWRLSSYNRNSLHSASFVVIYLQQTFCKCSWEDEWGERENYPVLHHLSLYLSNLHFLTWKSVTEQIFIHSLSVPRLDLLIAYFWCALSRVVALLM